MQMLTRNKATSLNRPSKLSRQIPKSQSNRRLMMPLKYDKTNDAVAQRPQNPEEAFLPLALAPRRARGWAAFTYRSSQKSMLAPDADDDSGYNRDGGGK
jgi:hypothetical protein